jgi:hypothetical protein
MQKRDRRVRARNSEVREGPKPGRRPTPIWVTPRARSLLVFALLALLALLAYAAPAVPLIAAGGFALALALSFPVRVISRFLPRPAAIAASFVLLILSSVLAVGRVLLDFARPRLRVGPVTALGSGPTPDG